MRHKQSQITIHAPSGTLGLFPPSSSSLDRNLPPALWREVFGAGLAALAGALTSSV